MKTTVEINGYLITIEEVDGNISVAASKDEEIVEEFTIEVEEGQEGEEGDVQGFGEFGQDEEDDFGQDEEDDFGQDDEEGDDFGQEDEEEEGEEMSQLESFQAFINKNKK
jgi:hypothetical protein